MIRPAGLHTFVGRCPLCMRRAFLLATASWMVTLVLLPLGVVALSVSMITISIALTILWLTHVVVRATTVQRARKHSKAGVQLSRRRLGATLFKSVVALSLASALPSLASATTGCSDCEEARRKCYAGCPDDISERPHCLNRCTQKYPCIPGRDCE